MMSAGELHAASCGAVVRERTQTSLLDALWPTLVIKGTGIPQNRYLFENHARNICSLPLFASSMRRIFTVERA